MDHGRFVAVLRQTDGFNHLGALYSGLRGQSRPPAFILVLTAHAYWNIIGARLTIKVEVEVNRAGLDCLEILLKETPICIVKPCI